MLEVERAKPDGDRLAYAQPVAYTSIAGARGRAGRGALPWPRVRGSRSVRIEVVFGPFVAVCWITLYLTPFGRCHFALNSVGGNPGGPIAHPLQIGTLCKEWRLISLNSGACFDFGCHFAEEL